MKKDDHIGVIQKEESLDNEEVSVEEKWDLPQDFDLFSKHEVHEIYFPPNSNQDNRESGNVNVNGYGYGDNNSDNDGCQSSKHRLSFHIECLEPSSPLDITNKSNSDATKYDATGHCVWAGAFLLIQCMEEILDTGGVLAQIEDGRIIELGAGTGIGGLSMTVASKDRFVMPQMVCYTDADPAALDVCRRNCDLNSLLPDEYEIEELTWGEEFKKCDDADEKEMKMMFDLALATDVLYEIDLCGPLFTTVSQSIPVGAIFVLSHVPRACYNEGNPPEAVENLEQYIMDRAQEHGLVVEKVIRPPSPDNLDEEILEWCSKDAFRDSAVIVFRRM